MRAWTGISTSVYIGVTKPQVKLANYVAKQNSELGGVCNPTNPKKYDHWIICIPVVDSWSLEPDNTRRLEALRCNSAADVRVLDPRIARKTMTLVGERLQRTLQHGLPRP